MPRLPDPDGWEEPVCDSLTVYSDSDEPDVLYGPDGEVLREIWRPFGYGRWAAERQNV